MGAIVGATCSCVHIRILAGPIPNNGFNGSACLAKSVFALLRIALSKAELPSLVVRQPVTHPHARNSNLPRLLGEVERVLEHDILDTAHVVCK